MARIPHAIRPPRRRITISSHAALKRIAMHRRALLTHRAKGTYNLHQAGAALAFERNVAAMRGRLIGAGRTREEALAANAQLSHAISVARESAAGYKLKVQKHAIAARTARGHAERLVDATGAMVAGDNPTKEFRGKLLRRAKKISKR